MTLVDISPETLKACALVHKRMEKYGENVPWWYMAPVSLPPKAILAKSTGRGIVKPDVKVYLIGGHNKTVWPDGAPPAGMEVHEYVGLIEGTGWQPLVQLGRDVEMV